ncbi:MAG: long-chain acyl-CoA synthetase, partial [Actinomycetota bacterium]|nr:long-chain acyl-CoA synthetase [Actinomycetota bacterium]
MGKNKTLMDLPQMLRRTAARVSSKEALLVAGHPDQTVTFGELDRSADRIAGGLAAMGIEPGDRVAIMMPNVPHFAAAHFGVLRRGAVVVPLNTMLTPHEIGRILADSGAKALFVAPPCEDAAAEGAREAGGVKVIRLSDWDAWDEAAAPEVQLSDDDLAVLAYTSGTTGEAKGAMLTHGNLYANLEQQMAVPEAAVDEDDVLFLTLPLFHIYGLNVALGLLVMNGASGLLVEKFEPVSSLKWLEEFGVTVVFGAPPMYKAWLATPGAEQYDLSKVRLAISGAAALPGDVLDRFASEFGISIFEGYGLTETAPSLTSNRMAGVPRADSVGLPLPGIELRVVDESGNDVELGDTGEIVVRGPNVFKGYWNRPKETEAAFVDGWFRTGDIAVRDEEGYLYLVDRRRDLIIVSGFNVFPAEVED